MGHPVFATTLNPVLFRLWGGRVEVDFFFGGGQLKLTTYNEVWFSIYEIPARRLDLNLIESLFYYARCELFKQAKEQRIEKEAYEE